MLGLSLYLRYMGDSCSLDDIRPRRKSSLVLVRMHNTFLDFCETQEPVILSRRRFSSSMRRSCTDPRVLIVNDDFSESIVTIPCDLSNNGDNKENATFKTRERAQTSTDGCHSISRKKELNHKVFVGGLSAGTDEATLFDFMSRFGPIKNVTVKRNPLTGQSRRYAFVKFYGPPSVWIFEHSWVLEEHTIRISKYQVSSEWKNHYYSDECEE